MKRFLTLLVTLVLGAMLLSSCTARLAEKFDKFVNYVDNNYQHFTQRDWDKANAYFQDLMNEYTQNYQRISSSDRQIINECIGRYHAIALKSGINSVVVGVENAISSFASTVEGIARGISAFLEELGIL